MSAHVPDLPTILEALTLLGASGDALEAFPSHPDNLAFSFADALIEAQAAIYTDWRFHPTEALNEAWQRTLPYGVKGMIDEEDEETGFPKKIILQHAGIGSRYRFRIKGEDPCLHDILFGLATVLPADLQVRSLAPYEGTDSYLHIIQPAPVFGTVRELLGPWFDEIFSVHPSALKFAKAAGDVKPKRNLAKNFLKRTKKWLKMMEESHRKARTEIGRVLTCTDMKQLAPPWGEMKQELREAKLTKFLADFPLPKRFFFVAHELEMLALRELTEGAIDVLESRPHGWHRMHLALQYQVLALHLSREVGCDRVIDFHGGVDSGGQLLALAWALGDLKVVRWLSEELIRFPCNFKGWQINPLEPMLLQLYALWQGLDIDWANYPKAKLGVYRSLFAAWDEPARLPAALEICCDYHLIRTGESGYQEFFDHPFDILPAEILAVHRLRELQGLPMPVIAHPLMETALGSLPAPVRSPRDELLQKILDIIARDVPEFIDATRVTDADS
jgi:hypothetical protein